MGRSSSILVAVVVGVSGVENSLFEGSMDRVENQGGKSVFLEVLLNGEDAWFLDIASNRPRFIGKQLLCLGANSAL